MSCLQVNGFCITVDLGGRPLKQRDRLLSDSLLRFRMFILPASLGACGSDSFLLCLKFSLGGRTLKQWDRPRFDSLLRLRMFTLPASLGACSSDFFFVLLEV